MNKELKESIRFVGDWVYLLSEDECGNCCQCVGRITEMNDQEKEYYGIV